MNDWLKEYERWLASDFTDEETKAELKTEADKIIVSPAKNENCKELALTRKENVKLYDNITNYLGGKIFELSTLRNVAEFLANEREKFANLDIVNQSLFLSSLISEFARCAKVVCDLTILGGKKGVGTTLISKNITGKGYKLVKRNALGYKIYEEDLENVR